MDTAFREVAVGIGFTEGPVWLGDDRIVVTSMSRGLVTELFLGVPPEQQGLRSWETGGGPNGIALDPAGRMVVVQNGGRGFASRSSRKVVPGIQLIDGDRVLDVDVPESVAPNDCAFGPDGALWFTDPGTDEALGLGPRIRRWNPVDGTVATLDESLRFPNGLAFSADGSRLYVADSHRHTIDRFDVSGGILVPAGVFAEIPGTGPDGIAFDTAGNLYVAAFDSNDVVVLDADGSVLERLPTGDGSRPTNLCFAGEGLTTLVVTLASGGRVVAVDREIGGIAL